MPEDAACIGTVLPSSPLRQEQNGGPRGREAGSDWMPVKLWDSTEGARGPEEQAEVSKASSPYQIFSRGPTLGAHTASLQIAPELPAPAQRNRALRDLLCLCGEKHSPGGTRGPDGQRTVRLAVPLPCGKTSTSCCLGQMAQLGLG